MNNRKISATYVAFPEGLVKNSIVEVDSEGVIVAVERDVKNLDARAGVEYYNGLLIAGMVNCHCHLEYSYVKGMIARGGGMPKFISSIIDIKYNRPTELSEKISMASKWDDVMYKNGITAVGDHNNNDYVTTIKSNSKIYYHTFIELYDADNQDAAITFAQGEKRAQEQRSASLTTSVVPHATYTIEDDLLALIGSEANRGVLSTHFLETVELGGEGEANRVIDAISESRDGVLFVHDIYATEEVIRKAIAKYGNKLTVAPCPLSNEYIENRLADYDMLVKSGVRIAIGTDGLSSNECLSILEEMKCIQSHFPRIPLEMLLTWGTINGAQALEIANWAGSIEVGKKPGLVLIDNVDMRRMKLTNTSAATRII